MVKFTKQGSPPLLTGKWPKGLYSGIKVFLTLFLLNFISLQLFAQTPPKITVDGDPSDWAAVLKSKDASIIAKTFRHDANNTNDDQWTGGSQDPDMVNRWFWVKGNTNDKGDITNAGAILIGRTIYFFGDRTATEGDAQIGFWFFLGGISQSGDGASRSGFSGTNKDGDILAISNFTNGGGASTPTIYKRVGTSLVDVTKTHPAFVSTNKDKKKQYVPSGVTTTDPDWPFPESWTFTPKSGGVAGEYPDPLFFEGYISFEDDKTASLCFTNFLLETRNSQSLNASLQDFVAGAFDVTPKKPTPEGTMKCLGIDLPFTASCSSGGSTPRWYIAAEGGEPIGTGSPFTLKAPALGDHTLYVSCYNATTGCESARVPVTGTIYQVTCEAKWLKDVTCYGGKDGSATVTPSGGFAPYSYLWDNGETTQTATALDGTVAGKVHTVKVTDKNGCETTCQVTIKQPPLLECSITKDKDVSCYKGSDGAATVKATGGTAPYRYFWPDWVGIPEQPASRTDLKAGTYKVKVLDANGCETSCEVTIGEPFELKASCAVTKAVSCLGADGEITVTVTGGTEPYSYSLNGGTAQTSNVFTKLGPGDYTITVTDKNGCKATTGTCTLVPPQCAHIFPTQTSCCHYTSKTANELTTVCYSLPDKGKQVVSNAIPGVFFYYGDLTAPANGPFVIEVKQSNSHLNSGFKAFLIHNAANKDVSQIRMFDAACGTTVDFTPALIDGGSGAKLTVNGFTPGAKYVISVKFDTKSIIGSTATGAPTVTYTFWMTKNGAQDGGSIGKLLAKFGCSDNTPNPPSCTLSTNTVAVNDGTERLVEQVNGLTVSALPNPFNDRVRFTMNSPESGQGTLEVFNMLGQKVKTVFQGHLQAGRPQQVEFQVPPVNRENLIYILRVGKHQATGKLINRR